MRLSWRNITRLNVVNLVMWLGWTCLAAFKFNDAGLTIGCGILTMIFLAVTHYSDARACKEELRYEKE